MCVRKQRAQVCMTKQQKNITHSKRQTHRLENPEREKSAAQRKAGQARIKYYTGRTRRRRSHGRRTQQSRAPQLQRSYGFEREYNQQQQRQQQHQLAKGRRACLRAPPTLLLILPPRRIYPPNTPPFPAKAGPTHTSPPPNKIPEIRRLCSDPPRR